MHMYNRRRSGHGRLEPSIHWGHLPPREIEALDVDRCEAVA